MSLIVYQVHRLKLVRKIIIRTIICFNSHQLWSFFQEVWVLVSLSEFFISSYRFELLSSVLSFQTEELNFSISCRASLVAVILQFLFIWECFHFSMFLEKDSFAGYSIFAWQVFISFSFLFFFDILKYHIVIWPPWLLVRILLSVLLEILCIWWLAALLLISRFSVLCF